MTVSIADIAEEGGLVGGPFGSSLVSADYVNSGIPVIRGSNMQGRYVSGPFVFVSAGKFAKDLARNTARPGDLVFTQRGTLGQVAMVPKGPYEGYVVSQSQMRLRVDPTKAVPAFVYYACTTPHFLRQIDDKAIRTGVPHTNLGILATLELPRFGLSEQRAIAEVLGALDDKITANARLLGTIYQLGLTHFTRHATETAGLTDLARFVNGRNFTKGASGTGRVVIRIAELNSGLGGSTVYSTVESPTDHLANPGDILFAWSGSLTLKRWMLPTGIVNQHIFKVIPNGSTPAWLAFHALRTQMPAFKAIAADKATTMGHIQRKHLEVDVLVPEPEAQRKMQPLMQPLWDLELATEQECQKLAQLRDTLLPALMDGRLRVRDAITQAEDLL